MDEFNLAAPEYYFSQLLQLMSRPAGPDRVLRLFDATSVRQSSNGTVDRIELNANVNFWGTINYDETTERLSPRLLDRSGMIFLGVGDVVPLSAGTTAGTSAAGSSKGIAARQLVERFIRNANAMPEESWTLLEPFLSMIAKPSDTWGEGATLSPRVLEAVKRYLANAKDLLPAERAVDYVIEQRVLPVLRGRGPKFTERMKVLADMLSEKGLNRSALHVKDALSIAESNFGDVDFLAY
jgi:hypothetical protein